MSNYEPRFMLIVIIFFRYEACSSFDRLVLPAADIHKKAT